MNYKIGDRVGAILSLNDDRIEFLGYGIYDGNVAPDGAAGSMGKILAAAGLGNPKILLDSGKVVWGCECWWDSEEKIKEVLEGRNVVPVDIDEIRESLKENHA